MRSANQTTYGVVINDPDFIDRYWLMDLNERAMVATGLDEYVTHKQMVYRVSSISGMILMLTAMIEEALRDHDGQDKDLSGAKIMVEHGVLVIRVTVEGE